MPSWKKIVVSGSNATLNSLFVSTAVTASRFSGSFTGSLLGTASWALNSISSSYSRNITGSQYFAAIYSSNNSLFTGSIYDSGSFTAIGATAPVDPSNTDRLFIDAGITDSYNLLSGHGEINSYLQLNIQNFSAGNTASSDIVASNNTATETTNFINMGINGDGYAITDGIGSQNDAYLYSTGENLLIGNAAQGKKVIIFNGTGSALDNARIFIVPEGTVGINSQDPNLTNPESLLVEPIAGATNPTDFNNLIVGKGTVHENYLQLNIINLGSGSFASADIVATNNSGSETGNYVDLGINGSNFSGLIGGPNEAYLYTTGSNLLIGNITRGTNANLKLFAGNDATVFPVVVTGSQALITGSLYGTASWALNVIGGAAGAITIADEGSAQGTATFLNFIGSGVSAIVSSNTASITISGGGTGQVSKLSQTTPATTWSFAHNLGEQYPVINVYDSAGDALIPGRIETVDANNARVYFTIATSGTAVAVVGGTATTSSYANTFIISSSLLTSQQNFDVDIGTEVVATVSTGSYTAAFFDYFANDGTNYRAGTVMSTWNTAGTVTYTDNSTLDIGSTSGVTLAVVANGSNVELRATVTSNNWNVKAFTRAL